MGQLYFTIGLPRSGKTTLAKKFLKGESVLYNNRYLDFPNEKNIVISLDDFRLAFGHRFNGYAEPSVFYTSFIATRALLIGGYNILIDDTHSTEESIRRMFRIATNAKYFRTTVDVELCKERAIQAGTPDLCEVIDRIYNNLVTLTDERIEQIRNEVINNVSMDYVSKD